LINQFDNFALKPARSDARQKNQKMVLHSGNREHSAFAESTMPTASNHFRRHLTNFEAVLSLAARHVAEIG